MTDTLTEKVKAILPWDGTSLDDLDLAPGNIFAIYNDNQSLPLLLIGTVGGRGLYEEIVSKDNSDLKLLRTPLNSLSHVELRILDARNLIGIDPQIKKVYPPGSIFYDGYRVKYAWIGKESILAALNENPLKDISITKWNNIIRGYCEFFKGK